MKPNDTPEPNLMRALESLLPKDPTPPLPPVLPGKPTNVLAYERIACPSRLSDAILLFAGESLLVRNPFRWMLNGQAVSNAYESHDMDGVCSERGWKIEARFGDHIAVISGADQPIALANGIGVEPTSDPCESVVKDSLTTGAKPEAGMVSNTPRTDYGEETFESWAKSSPRADRMLVDAFLCRTIESELSQANATVGRLLAAVKFSAGRIQMFDHGGDCNPNRCVCGLRGFLDTHEAIESGAITTPPAPDGWREISEFDKKSGSLYVRLRDGLELPAYCDTGGFIIPDGVESTYDMASVVFSGEITHFRLPKPPTGKGGGL